jgi:hypothetical protein
MLSDRPCRLATHTAHTTFIMKALLVIMTGLLTPTIRRDQKPRSRLTRHDRLIKGLNDKFLVPAV